MKMSGVGQSNVRPSFHMALAGGKYVQCISVIFLCDQAEQKS